MKIYEECFPIKLEKDLLPAPFSELLFFDIETTGFSPASSYIYLIGCVYYAKEEWKITQFFLDDLNTEKELLLSFFSFIEPYHYLIQFNGQTFDIPFLKKRAQKYHLSHSLSDMILIDLYQEIRPFKNMLGISGLKQKDLELYLNVARKDPFNGGELIEVYYDYIETKKKASLKALLLHNADDLRGMLKVLSLRSYSLFFHGNFTLMEVREQVFLKNDLFTQKNEFWSNFIEEEVSILLMTFSVPYYFPKPFSCTSYGIRLEGVETTAHLYIPIYQGTLKSFYSNYQNYDYLPDKDYAISKNESIAIPKERKQQAKASNCYYKKDGCFLLQFSKFREPVYQKNYKDSIFYFEMENFPWQEETLLKNYSLHLLERLAGKK